MKHIGIYCDNSVNKQLLIHNILNNSFLNKYLPLNGLKGEPISSILIDQLIDEEFYHDRVVLSSDKNSNLESMSSGQQRMALAKYVFDKKLDFIILDDIHNNIDKVTLSELLNLIESRAENYHYIQLFSRKEDLLSYMDIIITIDSNLTILKTQYKDEFLASQILLDTEKTNLFSQLLTDVPHFDPIVEMKNISVSYFDKPVLNNISWTIRHGEFWELRGPIGSGKSTMLSMIIGDNPKAFGQNITVFGMKKGSGESVWEIKKNIGYFYPKMLQLFKRNYSNEEMIISGYYDSIGLYTTPTESQKIVASQWLESLDPIYKEKKFQNLSHGQQRIIMLIRSIVKQPPLLILDEPTVGLDDQNAKMFVSLLNNIATQNKITILFVSHRKEQGLNPNFIFELTPNAKGSSGKAILIR